MSACRLIPKPNNPPAISATITLKQSSDWAKLGVFDGWGDMKDLLNRFKNESSEKQYNDFAMRWNDFGAA